MKDFSLSKNIAVILKSPAALAALAGIIILTILLLKTRKVRITPRITAQIGIALALSLVLNMFKIYRLPQGGSVTLGGMVPILLISFLYGPEAGFLTGLLYGILDLLLEPYIVHPIQLLFDYPLPFMALGIAGYFKSHKMLGTTTAILARFVFHFISGFVFFADYSHNMTPVLYSLIYNGSFLSIDGLICIIIIGILPIDRLRSIANRNIG